MNTFIALANLSLATMVTVAAVSDARTRRIPNWLVASGLVIALIAQLVLHAPTAGALQWLGGAATGMGLCLGIYVLGGMGAGDVKLMGAMPFPAFHFPYVITHPIQPTFARGPCPSCLTFDDAKSVLSVLKRNRTFIFGKFVPDAARKIFETSGYTVSPTTRRQKPTSLKIKDLGSVARSSLHVPATTAGSSAPQQTRPGTADQDSGTGDQGPLRPGSRERTGPARCSAGPGEEGRPQARSPAGLQHFQAWNDPWRAARIGPRRPPRNASAAQKSGQALGDRCVSGSPPGTRYLSQVESPETSQS